MMITMTRNSATVGKPNILGIGLGATGKNATLNGFIALVSASLKINHPEMHRGFVPHVATRKNQLSTRKRKMLPNPSPVFQDKMYIM